MEMVSFLRFITKNDMFISNSKNACLKNVLCSFALKSILINVSVFELNDYLNSYHLLWWTLINLFLQLHEAKVMINEAWIHSFFLLNGKLDSSLAK